MQHRFGQQGIQNDGRPVRVVRLNQRRQLRSGDHSIHLVQELALASAFGRQVQSKGCLFHVVRPLQWFLALTDTIGGDGAYDSKPCHAEIAARGAQPSIPPRDGAKPWSESTPGAAWRNEAIDVIEKSSRREWKAASGYHRRSLAETLMYRLKTLTGHGLWAREIGSQATEVAIRAGVLNRMVALARPQSACIA